MRVPDHPTVRALLAAYGEPFYATSANLSGEPAPASLAGVDPRVFGAVDVVLEGEPGSGEASAVVDLSEGRTRLLRLAGDLTEEKLSALARDASGMEPDGE
jgi:L-threonylcarbamoyladenylate synthase